MFSLILRNANSTISSYFKIWPSSNYEDYQRLLFLSIRTDWFRFIKLEWGQNHQKWNLDSSSGKPTAYYSVSDSTQNSASSRVTNVFGWSKISVIERIPDDRTISTKSADFYSWLYECLILWGYTNAYLSNSISSSYWVFYITTFRPIITYVWCFRMKEIRLWRPTYGCDW